MEQIEKIHELAQDILNENKKEWSLTDLVILAQSQYYNIESLFIIGSEFKSDNIDEHIEISEEIVTMCNSFQFNVKSIPDMFSWKDSEQQKLMVIQIKKEVEGSLEIQKAIKDFQNSPTRTNAMKLQMIKDKLEKQ